MQLGSNLRFAICAVGIFVCYFGYGIIQEKITRGKYVFEGKEERFTAITALVFFQCAVNYIYALIMSYVFPTKEKDTTKSSYYGICSLTYLVAMVTSNKALSWVNYPTQVIGKSCKPIPVMILGVLLGRKRYPLLKYLFILMIVAGVAMFMYKENAKKSGGGDSPSSCSATVSCPTSGAGRSWSSQGFSWTEPMESRNRNLSRKKLNRID